MNEQLDVLISTEDLAKRVQEMGTEIRAKYGDQPVVLLGVLKGSFPFLADLARAITGEVLVDFLQTSSYGADKSSSGVVQIKKDHDINIEGKHVIVVEDIVDTGLTLKHLLEILSTRKPASLCVASALSKPEAHEHRVPIEFLGFEIPPVFVVGYGLDYAERFRHLPYVAVLRES